MEKAKYFWNGVCNGKVYKSSEYSNLKILLNDVFINYGGKRASGWITKEVDGIEYVRHYYSDLKKYVWDVVEA